MEKEFEILEHTADVGIIAYGSDMKQAFASAARGMFSLITDLSLIEETEYRDIELTSSDEESLMVEWLNELIYLFDVENIVFKRFDIKRPGKTTLKARGYGQKVDTDRHEIKTGIKAATYHMLKIEKGDINRVQVLFDI
jgi:SHS2 domain-containing protein